MFCISNARHRKPHKTSNLEHRHEQCHEGADASNGKLGLMPYDFSCIILILLKNARKDRSCCSGDSRSNEGDCFSSDSDFGSNIYYILLSCSKNSANEHLGYE